MIKKYILVLGERPISGLDDTTAVEDGYSVINSRIKSWKKFVWVYTTMQATVFYMLIAWNFMYNFPVSYKITDASEIVDRYKYLVKKQDIV